MQLQFSVGGGGGGGRGGNRAWLSEVTGMMVLLKRIIAVSKGNLEAVLKFQVDPGDQILKEYSETT